MVNLNSIRYKILKTIAFSFFIILSNCIVLYACEEEIDRFDAISHRYRGKFQELNPTEKEELIAHCDDKIERYKAIIPLIGKKRQYAQFLKAIKPFADQATLMRENIQTFNSSSAAILSLPAYYEGALKLWECRKEFILGGEGMIPKNLLYFTIEKDGEILRDKEDVCAQRKILIAISGFAKELSELRTKEWVHEKQISQVGPSIATYTEQCRLIKEMLKLQNFLEGEKLKEGLAELIKQQEKIEVLINTWEGTAHICQQLRDFLDENSGIMTRLRDSLRFQMSDYRASVSFLKRLSSTIEVSFYTENIDESHEDALSMDFIQMVLIKLDADVHLAFGYRDTLRNSLKEHAAITKEAKKTLDKMESSKSKEGAGKVPKLFQNIKVKTKPKHQDVLSSESSDEGGSESRIKSLVHKKASRSREKNKEDKIHCKEDAEQSAEGKSKRQVPPLVSQLSFNSRMRIEGLVSPRHRDGIKIRQEILNSPHHLGIQDRTRSMAPKPVTN